MNLFADIRALVVTSLEGMVQAGVLAEGLSFDNVTVEPPRDASHGDMATNAAMVLAKPSKMKPRDIADALAAALLNDPRIEAADVAGPGFLNLRLSKTLWQGVVKSALVDVQFGQSNLGGGKRSTWNTSVQTQRARCTWATPAGRFLVTRLPHFWRTRAMM